MNNPLVQLRELILKLPIGLQQHLERVRNTALELASIHEIPFAPVELAALGHDIARSYQITKLVDLAQEWQVDIHPAENEIPLLLHGPVSAEMLRLQCNIDDPQVLEAVRWHSTSIPGMSPLGLVVFLADKLEPHKLNRSARHKKIAQTAKGNLEQATIDYLSMEIRSLVNNGRLVHPKSIEARNYFINLIAKQK
jgi:predicted HD superfamily hydrolase involved in NAD metabolism